MGSFINRTRIRSNMVQENLAVYNIPLWTWRRVGDLTQLPTVPDGTNLALIAGTFGTNSPKLQGTDPAVENMLEYARTQLVLPVEYVAGETIILRLRAKVVVLPGDGQKVDVVCYKADGEGGIGSDICATAVQTITASFANYDFTITPTGLVVGDKLDIRLATETRNIAGTQGGDNSIIIGATQLLLDIKG